MARLGALILAAVLVSGCKSVGMSWVPLSPYESGLTHEKASEIIAQDLNAGEWLKAPYLSLGKAPGLLSAGTLLAAKTGMKTCDEKISIRFDEITSVTLSHTADSPRKTGVVVLAEDRDSPFCSYGITLGPGKALITNAEKVKLGNALARLGTPISSIDFDIIDPEFHAGPAK